MPILATSMIRHKERAFLINSYLQKLKITTLTLNLQRFLVRIHSLLAMTLVSKMSAQPSLSQTPQGMVLEIQKVTQ